MTTPIHRGMPCDPLEVEDDPLPEYGHVTPVGGWILIAVLVLLTLGVVAWGMTR